MNRYIASTPPGLVITALLLFGMQKLIDSGEDAVVASSGGLPVFIMRDVEIVPPGKRPPPPPPTKRIDPPTPNPDGPQVIERETGDDPFVPPGPPLPQPAGGGGEALPPPEDGPLVAIVRVAPQYPPDTSIKGLEGFAVVEFDVEANGTVSNARVIDTNHRAFGKSALRAVAKFRYRPRIVDGIPVATRQVRTRFRFELKGDE